SSLRGKYAVPEAAPSCAKVVSLMPRVFFAKSFAAAESLPGSNAAVVAAVVAEVGCSVSVDPDSKALVPFFPAVRRAGRAGGALLPFAIRYVNSDVG
ncbi:hypothetical protein, partial [Mesorhizobium sp. M1A.F.Ca.IN.020.06.1.1]|uniref:hypothetical protein n=1 Tax=Mesorhizobium sp. M1A.F.Ca.IN.020.06.1.1 TaxID=2496765 RepID=UPI0019D4C3D8